MKHVREANSADLNGILVLYKQLFPEDEYFNSVNYQDKWNEIMNCKHIKYFVVELNNRIVSTCHIVVIPNMTRSNKSYSIIENVVTDEKHRGLGFGKEVMMAAIKYAKESGCYKIMLLSSSKRIKAHSFYERLGFNGKSKKGFEIRF